MSRTAILVRCLAGLMILTTTESGTRALAKNPPDTEKSTITLRVYDYAHVNRPALLAAEGEATRIFADAGVNARWLDCPTSHAEWDNFPNCHSAARVNDYAVRVLPKAMVALQKKSQDQLGFAVDCEGVPHCPASIFYDRVRSLAGGASAPVEILLGRVMAHEIGHLLLGENSHSRTGIMRGSWTDRELSMEARHEMLFAAEQSRWMRTHLAEQARTWEAQMKVAELGRK